MASKPLLTGLAAALAAGAFLSALPTDPAVAAPKPVTIRIASDHGAPPHPAGLAEELFKERLAELIPGSEVRTFPQSALYKVPEAVEAMTEGNLEMTWGQSTSWVHPVTRVAPGTTSRSSTPASRSRASSHSSLAAAHGVVPKPVRAM